MQVLEMPSDFFFDLIESTEVRAEESQLCDSPEKARELAVKYARDIAAEQVRDGTLHLDHAIVVRDHRGQVIGTVRFGDVVAIDC